MSCFQVLQVDEQCVRSERLKMGEPAIVLFDDVRNIAKKGTLCKLLQESLYDARGILENSQSILNCFI